MAQPIILQPIAGKRGRWALHALDWRHKNNVRGVSPAVSKDFFTVKRVVR
jgi:hypothetical protein